MHRDNPEQQNRPSRGKLAWLLWVAGACGVVLMIALVVWSRMTPRPAPPKPADGPFVLSPQESRALVELKNVSIGHLENEQYAKAVEGFTEIVEKLPNEPLGVRNLAICRLLEIPAKQTDAATADAAVKRLLEMKSEAAYAHWFAAKLAVARKSAGDEPTMLAQAVDEFRQAADLLPGNAAVRYELYEAAANAADAALKAKAHQSLQEAYALQPENIFVTLQWLIVQAEAQDETIEDTLSAAKAKLLPVRESIQRLTRYDVVEFIDQARGAADNGQWGDVLVNVRRVANITRPTDLARSDQKRIVPHLLEFIVYDFSPQYYRDHPPEPPVESPRVDVKFRTLAEVEHLPGIAGAQDLLLADFDLDDKLDVIVVRDGALDVYGRGGDGDRWQMIASVELPPGFSHMLAADLDRDVTQEPAASSVKVGENEKDATQAFQPGDVDLIVYGSAGVQVLQNERDSQSGARTLKMMPEDAEAPTLENVLAATLADYDHDGDLDLVLSTQQGIVLWSNRGNWTFDDVSQWSVLPPADSQFTAAVAVDWDRDVDIDIVLGGPTAKTAGYLENLRHGQFRWRPLDEDFGALGSADALAVIEADGNSSWDLVAAGTDGVRLARTVSPTSGTVKHLSSNTLSTQAASRVTSFDYDNDGHTDVVAWNDNTLRILRGGPDGIATRSVSEEKPNESPRLLDDTPQNIVACDTGDIDGDGDLDLVLATAGGIVIYSNDGGNRNRWLDIRLRGEPDETSGRVNHLGIGSLMELKAGTQYQAQVVTRQSTHFGLGQQTVADVVRVLWTNGVPDTIVRPQPNQVIRETMSLKGSCPYVYTWTGEQYEFFTDLLWAAPLGLQFAEGVIAPDRPWEYLKIPGERLRPKDGAYRLQVTEELWEAAYFDQIELIAVDHPAGVEIYSNEKVGPPQIAEFKIHTVRQHRVPIAARDQRDRDVLEKIRSRDGVYLRAFDRTLRQGLTEPHYLELDLGPLDDPRRITLFLTGWIYPTDTSLNIALSQDSQLDAPRPPHVLVPDGQGDWREAIAYMGFPGGKTKTIAVDLSDVLVPGDYRLRIATTAQIYWDEAFFTVDEQPADVRTTPLVLESADLHYRGYSQPLPKQEQAPETYDYERLSRDPKWPPMQGSFTRYGEVRPLLTATDDLMLIMSAGDEVTLSFTAPFDDPPPGWTRDFLLHNVGWDKDADLNTLFGQSVEPLPFTAMKSYPYTNDESYPQSPRHQDYLRQYQTRQQSAPAFWKQLLPSRHTP